MAQYFLVSLFFVPFLYLIFKHFKTSSKKIPPLPPGPTPWPLLGNIPHMATKMPHVTLTDFSKIHGPLMLLRLGTQKMVVASSPAAAKEILKTHDRLLSARYIPKSIPPEDINNSSILWTEPSNDGWKFVRTLCRTELFSAKTLDAQSWKREKKISEMIEHIAKNEGENVNIADLVFATVYNMLSNVLLSMDVIGLNEKSEDGGFKGMIRKMFEEASVPNIADLYPILSRFDVQGIRRNSRKMVTKIRAIYEPTIQERRKAQGARLSHNDFLDVLLLNKFTDAQIHVLFLELLGAGTDTSTSTVEWTMAELIKNPESMKKVIEELEREVGTCNPIKEYHIPQLSYLQACIKEILRLHPPGPLLLPRRALETCEVMDYTIPKDAQIYINIWAMGRDPTIWDEPLMFKPERFLNGAVDFKGKDFEFIPFGGGRRICPGLPMAGRHVPLVIASLLHSFDWSMPNGEGPQELDMTEKFGIALHKEQPLVLIPKQKK